MEQSIEGAYREWIEIFNSNKKALKIAVDIPQEFLQTKAGFLEWQPNVSTQLLFRRENPDVISIPVQSIPEK
ncbi:MAG: hypothetical protein Ct9H300mP28_34880 [Pseudomonadota bacterium]|nr:MAG: hypothetical protein Ct9H300mP28_34880 [Pseudomonadota bacterium]